MQNILSFDCANKTLGYCNISLGDYKLLAENTIRRIKSIENSAQILNFATQNNQSLADFVHGVLLIDCEAWTQSISTKQIEDFARQLNAIIAEFKSALVIKSIGVIDIMPDLKVRDVSKCQRTKLLYDALEKIPINGAEIVLVEEQPPIGHFNNTVQDQIMMYYLSKGLRIAEISPNKKNKLSFGGTNATFKNGAKSKRVANKNHSIANTNALGAMIGVDFLSGVKKSLREHASDALMQAISFSFSQSEKEKN